MSEENANTAQDMKDALFLTVNTVLDLEYERAGINEQIREEINAFAEKFDVPKKAVRSVIRAYKEMRKDFKEWHEHESVYSMLIESLAKGADDV